MNDIQVSRTALKFLTNVKRCPAALKEKFLSEMSALYEDLEAGIALTGGLSGCYKIPFSFKGVEYRIIYEVFTDNSAIVVYCGPRERAYDKIKRGR